MDKITIAIVDDQSFIRHVYSAELKRESFEVISFESGKQLIEHLENNELDLILLDAIMPEMDGFETCKKLRDCDNKTPVIFLTANSDKNTVVKAIQSGGDDFALKNSDSVKLIKKIYKLLDKNN